VIGETSKAETLRPPADSHVEAAPDMVALFQRRQDVRWRLIGHMSVGMQEPEDFPGRHRRAGIHLAGASAGRANYHEASALDDVCRSVLAATVRDDDFDALERKSRKLCQQTRQFRRFVQYRDHEGQVQDLPLPFAFKRQS